MNSYEVLVTELFEFKIAGCNPVSVSLQTSVISTFPIRPNFQKHAQIKMKIEYELSMHGTEIFQRESSALSGHSYANNRYFYGPVTPMNGQATFASGIMVIVTCVGITDCVCACVLVYVYVYIYIYIYMKMKHKFIFMNLSSF